MSRSDIKEFGEVIDVGAAALVVVGESTIEEAVDKAGLKAEKQIAKELDVKPQRHRRGRPASRRRGQLTRQTQPPAGPAPRRAVPAFR
jgi:hypothetical protein